MKFGASIRHGSTSYAVPFHGTSLHLNSEKHLHDLNINLRMSFGSIIFLLEVFITYLLKKAVRSYLHGSISNGWKHASRTEALVSLFKSVAVTSWLSAPSAYPTILRTVHLNIA